MRAPTKYNAEMLAPLVASSRSYSEVIRKLGLQPTGGIHRMVTTRIRQAGLDTSHFSYGKGPTRFDAIPQSTLADLVSQSTSVAQVLSKLNLPVVGRPHRDLKSHIKKLGLATAHFKGPGWSRGETYRSHPALDRGRRLRMLPNDVVFVENGPLVNGPRLIRRLLDLGWEYRCAWCGIDSWREKPLVLHCDHINGINNDNRFENLRFLCPNCHSQTDTYCNRRR